jgi:uncharacterized delta-60 repeat protein
MDGSLDGTFNPGSGPNSRILHMEIQPNGSIVIGGTFTSYDGNPRTHVARILSDGSLDFTFDPGAGANSFVTSLQLAPDGKILVGGSFNTYDGTSRNHITRLKADGSIDATFDPGTGVGGPNPDVPAMVLQPDGKILIGGDFDSYNGTSVNDFARLLGDAPVGIIETAPLHAHFTIYPNPSNGLFYVEAPAGTTLEVYDLRGGKLLKGRVENGSHTLDLSAYAKGVYLLRLQSGDRIETQRLMRE